VISVNVLSYTVSLVLRIIEPIAGFVQADYWIPTLDFVGKLNEITTNERAKGI
jgi:hypothetical protein